ncbi:tyrosine-type recombinase/integrase [Anaerocolumna aminovalerica]|jgi:integrase|uniref:tyrosine-type recombinase/integrase n=1 Tax=Anaerocolumna aminovalerica TaxID=1527 RepID=UPI00248C5F40|nr:tyrosine-type recombinase/integrase [Anaerocolumna aminovalerica]
MGLDKYGRELPKGIYYDVDGDFYLGRFQYQLEKYSVTDKNLTVCIQMLNDLKYEVRHGLAVKKVSLTVDAWFPTWIRDYKEMFVKKGTIEVYTRSYKLYIKPFIGKMKLQDVKSMHVQRIYNELKKEEFSRGTIEVAATVLSGMFKQAYKNELIVKNPVPLATLPKIEDEDEIVRAMTLEEQNLFTEYAKESWIYPLVITALFTGMRSGELRGIKWKDVDFKKKEIHIRKTLVYLNKEYSLEPPKTKSSKRDIPMLDNVYQLLKEHKKQQLERKLLLGEQWKTKKGMEDLVFPSDTGNPLNRDRLKVQVNKIVDAINGDGTEFQHITPHYWRHSFATRCIEQGMQPKVLQKILGHSKLSQTMDLYAHVMPSTKEQEMQKLLKIAQSA